MKKKRKHQTKMFLVQHLKLKNSYFTDSSYKVLEELVDFLIFFCLFLQRRLSFSHCSKILGKRNFP